MYSDWPFLSFAIIADGSRLACFPLSPIIFPMKDYP